MNLSEEEKVPFFSPSIDTNEIEAVANCLKSGWLTTGPLTRKFEQEFAQLRNIIKCNVYINDQIIL